jgi:EAL domain-containing protein (putative c-di-GMP-specific phosphodiesterase class I)
MADPLQARVRVLIVDDDPDIQVLLSDVIADAPTLELVGVAGEADEAIQLAAQQRPDVAIVDVRMPGGGVAAAKGIRRSSRETQIIALSSSDERETVMAMLEAGAASYLLKDASAAAIVQSIIGAVAGESSLSGPVASGVIEELIHQRSQLRSQRSRMDAVRARIDQVLSDEDTWSIYLQPICSLQGETVVGAEALSRFRPAPEAPPYAWFAEAAEVGLRAELELLAVARALEHLTRLPAQVYLSLNASPSTVCEPRFRALIEGVESARLVVEITETAPVEDYDTLRRTLGQLRSLGVRFAVDDAGAGFASLRHILNLTPDMIKLDRTLIAGIERDRARQALAAGLTSFAGELGATLVAEGIETRTQLDALVSLGVDHYQGFFLSRPEPAACFSPHARQATESRLRELHDA